MTRPYDPDRDYDPMIYDAMRETANVIMGRYIAWEYAASTQAEKDHWSAETNKIQDSLQKVDPDSLCSVRAKQEELKTIFANLPKEAPQLTAL